MIPDQLPEDPAALKQLVADLGAALDAKQAELDQAKQKLEAALHRLKTMLREKFGRKSERIAPGQNLLAFPGVMEELQSAGATAADIAAFKEELEAELKPHPVRQAALDESLPLEEKTHDLPEEDRACDNVSVRGRTH